MRIELHYEMQAGKQIGVHVIHTERQSWNQITVASIQAGPMDMIDYLKILATTPTKVVGTGWDAMSNHPLYPGKTLLQVVLAEVVRLNDAAARALLGV